MQRKIEVAESDQPPSFFNLIKLNWQCLLMAPVVVFDKISKCRDIVCHGITLLIKE